MDFVTTSFQNLSIISYLTFIVVLLCFFLSKNLKYDRKNSPIVTLIIANISFWFFLGSIPGNFDLSIQIILVLSVGCICWFLWMKMDENQENKDRGFLRSGQETVANRYQNAKQSVKNKASETVGGGFFGELLGNAVDMGTRNLDGKVSGFLGLFGDNSEYIHSSRTVINTLRNLLIISMIVVMIYSL